MSAEDAPLITGSIPAHNEASANYGTINEEPAMQGHSHSHAVASNSSLRSLLLLVALSLHSIFEGIKKIIFHHFHFCLIIICVFLFYEGRNSSECSATRFHLVRPSGKSFLHRVGVHRLWETSFVLPRTINAQTTMCSNSHRLFRGHHWIHPSKGIFRWWLFDSNRLKMIDRFLFFQTGCSRFEESHSELKFPSALTSPRLVQISSCHSLL